MMVIITGTAISFINSTSTIKNIVIIAHRDFKCYNKFNQPKNKYNLLLRYVLLLWDILNIITIWNLSLKNLSGCDNY